MDRFTRKACDEGYACIKLHEIELAAIEAGRAAAPAPIRLVTDVNCNWTPDQAETLMVEMHRMGLYWVEEPIYPPDAAEALGRLQSRHRVSIASGENAATVEGFAAIAKTIDFLQPSVTKVGGISEFVSVCELASAHGKRVMPHSPYFGPGYWATAHLMAARPECELFEMLYIEPQDWLDSRIPLPRHGELSLPDGPGLGFEPDPALLERHAA
ncbi:MAG: enolase C-terminal domain-like protein [Burkholderiaceae bacterium]